MSCAWCEELRRRALLLAERAAEALKAAKEGGGAIEAENLDKSLKNNDFGSLPTSKNHALGERIEFWK